MLERSLMMAGRSFSDAYLVAIDDNHRRRDSMETLVSRHPPVLIPDSLTRFAGEIDPGER
jgi:hypothetical protein